MGIQAAQGDELGRVAKQAYDEERTRQKTELAKIHQRSFDLLPIEALLKLGQLGFEQQSHAIEQYLEKSHEQVMAMNAVPATCELIVEYKEAAKQISKEVHSIVASEFAPLLKNDFLELAPEHIDYLDGLLGRMVNAPYKDAVASMLPRPTGGAGGTSVEVARQSIMTFRDLKENVSEETFSSLSPEQQAEALRRLPKSNQKYSRLVKEFRAAHQTALSQATSLLESAPANVLQGAMETAFKEVRSRTEASSDLKDAKLSDKPLAALEELAKSKRASLQNFLINHHSSPLIAAQEDNEGMDKQLLSLMQTYTSLVKITSTSAAPPGPFDSGSTTGASVSIANAAASTNATATAAESTEAAAPAESSFIKAITSFFGGGKDKPEDKGAGQSRTPEEEAFAQSRLHSLDDDANRAITASDFSTARRCYLEAFGVSKMPQLLEKAANMALKLGDTLTAKAEYEQLMQVQDVPGIRKVRATAKKKLEEMQDELDRLEVDQRRSAQEQQPGFQPARSVPNATDAAKVLYLLVAKLKQTLASCFGKAEAPRDLTMKHHALLRLQRWEPSRVAAANQLDSSINEDSLFAIAAQLEAALIGENSLPASYRQAMAPPVPHEERKRRVYDELDAAIDDAVGSLGGAATFDPQVDLPLDPKPFELIFSTEMNSLIEYVGPQLRVKTYELNDKVAGEVDENVRLLQSFLQNAQNKEANDVLQAWKFFEPLTKLNAFKNLPGATAFDKVLHEHVEKLESQAMRTVQTTTIVDVAEADGRSRSWQKQISRSVMILGKLSSDIPRASKPVKVGLANVLDAVEQKFGADQMQLLAVEMKGRNAALGQEIVNGSLAFAFVKVADFNLKTKRDILEVKRLYQERNGAETDAVWSKYDEFRKHYDQMLREATDDLVPNPDPLASLITQTKTTVQSDSAGWLTSASQKHMPKVLAGIFAWWSVKFYVDLKKRNPHLKADPNKLLQPNSVQVVCILRLLGAKEKLQNHLAEVPTGEGKSVILGVLATTLALYGFNVDCVCYSSMLSSRDCDDFMEMFTAFGLTDRIRYGTFDTLCEQLLTEKYGDLRQSTADLIAKGSSVARPAETPPKRVLIIDEVDVFCSEAFFGGAFCPTLTLKNDEVTALTRHIWSLKDTPGLDLPALKQSGFYQAVLQSGVMQPTNEWLLERAVREMDKASRSYSPKTRDHLVNADGKIEYKIDGRDEYGPWSYNYDTNADYLGEFERGELTEQQLKNGLALHVRCGEFSYAMLPTMFQHILGVTGTLNKDRLPPKMHDVLKEEVGIKLFTYCPSMFPEQKRDWKPASPAYVQRAKNTEEHYHLIVDEIDTRMTPTTEMQGKRSVLIFFRNAAELANFRDSSYFAKYKAEALVLSERAATNAEDREHIITGATRQGQVTLATRIYGRGTDFKIHDDRMEKCGGMHVIQTFFSRDLSEEIQIMGRCARQGCRGSYSQVLLGGLDKTPDEIDKWDAAEVHSKLAALRAQEGEAEVQTLREMAKERKQEHEVLARSLKAFQLGQTAGLATLAKRYNSPGGLTIGPNGMHVVFCLDESGSMSFNWMAPWKELVSAFNAFWDNEAAKAGTGPPMYASVVQFGRTARTTIGMMPIQGAAPELSPQWSGTCFHPATVMAQDLINQHGPSNGYTAVVVFMSDGAAGDAAPAAQVLGALAKQHPGQFESHTVGFGDGAPTTLERMAFANGEPDKNKYRAAAVGNLTEAFTAIAKSISPGRL